MIDAKDFLNFSSSTEFNQIMAQAIKLKDLDKYFLNLDKLAIINEKEDLTLQDVKTQILISSQQENLLHNLRTKVLKIINQYANDINRLAYEAEILMFEINDDLDMMDFSKDERLELYKRYVVAKLIVEIVNYINKQEKTL